MSLSDFLSEESRVKKNPFSTLYNEFMDYAVERLSIVSLNYDYIKNTVYNTDSYAEYFEFWEDKIKYLLTHNTSLNIKDKIIKKYGNKSGDYNKSMSEYFVSLLDIIDKIYCFTKEKRFFVNLNSDSFSFSKITDLTGEYSLFDYIDEIDLFRLGFSLNNNRYSDYIIQVLKPYYKFKIGDKKVNMLNINIQKTPRISVIFLFARNIPISYLFHHTVFRLY